MSKKDLRDMVGYGPKDKKIEWPNNARIAVQIVLNYEEGAENCVLNGDNHSEIFLSEIIGAQPVKGRHINMESLYEYGSRAGFWRLHKLFHEIVCVVSKILLLNHIRKETPYLYVCLLQAEHQ